MRRRTDPFRKIVAVPPASETIRRLPQLVGGLIGCGVAFSLIIHAGFGLDPWNVLHQGIADHSDLAIGTVTIILSFVILIGWIPLRERVGVGTILNSILIGATIDAVLPRLPETDAMAGRIAYLVVGVALAGPVIGAYIGARLGPGPRDGIMTGLARRGPSIRLVRTGMELCALTVGWALGGTVGLGTLLFALTVGPNTQFWLERLDLGFPPGFDPDLDPVVEPGGLIAGE